MKYANRDINIVEWTNISTFSTLDDINTPLRPVGLIFEYVFYYLTWFFATPRYIFIAKRQMLVFNLLIEKIANS